MDASEHKRLAEHEEWYWWHRGRQRIVHAAIEHWGSPRPRILDVGCGTGHTTASLQRFGPVLGVDTGREALLRAQARGVAAARSNASCLPVARESVDLIVALDVLEHLDDDAAAAREMLASLAPNGLLVATVPAYSALWSSHDVALGHRRRYRRYQLRALLESAGFRIERCTYVMWAPLPFAAALRLAERLSPTLPAASGYVRMPGPLNELAARLVGFDGRLVRWGGLPFGLSVLAVARRPSS